MRERDLAWRIKQGLGWISYFWATAVFLMIYVWVTLFLSSKLVLQISFYFPFVYSFIQPKTPTA